MADRRDRRGVVSLRSRAPCWRQALRRVLATAAFALIACASLVLVGGHAEPRAPGLDTGRQASPRRLGFESFGSGLPTEGQWRSGFDVGDMNGDGHPDIVSGPARKSGGEPVIFLGDGHGSWQSWEDAVYPELPYDYGDVRVGDLNGNGRLDMALAMHLRGLVALLGDGQGHFRSASDGLPLTEGREVPRDLFSSRSLELVDWDGDGRQDIVALGEGPRPVGRVGPGPRLPRGAVLFRNRLDAGSGTWERRLPRVDDGPFGTSVAVGDFDGDGHPDIATGSSVMGRTDVIYLGGGAMRAAARQLTGVPPRAYVRAVVAADFDRDGRDDLAAAYVSFAGGAWRHGIATFALSGDDWVRRPLMEEEGRGGAVALGVGDLDGDGRKDLVALTVGGETWVLLGDGRHAFVREPDAIPPFAGRCRGAHVELADLDRDGRDEIIASFAEEPPDPFLGLDEDERCASEGGLTAWKSVWSGPGVGNDVRRANREGGQQVARPRLVRQPPQSVRFAGRTSFPTPGN